MVAYLVIGVELAVLYAVFWSVFIWEPNAPTANGEMWGSYDDDHPYPTTYSALSEEVDLFEDAYEEPKSSHHWNFVPDNGARKKRHQAAVARGRNSRAQLRRDQSLHSAWVPPEPSDEEKTLVGKLFDSLSKAINHLSVKVP